MALTPAVIRRNSLITLKQYNVYIPLFVATPFDQKLKENGIKFSDWLKESMEKYLKKNP